MGKVEVELERVRTVMLKVLLLRRCLRIGAPTVPLAWSIYVVSWW